MNGARCSSALNGPSVATPISMSHVEPVSVFDFYYADRLRRLTEFERELIWYVLCSGQAQLRCP